MRLLSTFRKRDDTVISSIMKQTYILSKISLLAFAVLTSLSGCSSQPNYTIEIPSDGTFDLNRKFRANFVEEDDFDEVWDSFGEKR